MHTRRSQFSKYLFVIWGLISLALPGVFTSTLAQTHEPPPGTHGNSEQAPEGNAARTESTVRNPYYNSRGQLQQIEEAAEQNQETMRRGVDRIITGEYTNLIYQAAEQGRGGDVQKIARNSLNASLGSINDTYRGLHKWFADDLVGNLFANIGQLMGKWLSELINGWIADTVQYLAQFLRIFVLNPNVAVNGLNGSQNDGISPYIRQGADVMYGIAVDLLLLLFILCIWKFWAEASWKGAGSLMSPVGRLIFTAGLLLAWPTIYAFEIQITNEMIKAIYFDSHDQLAMLHVALATAVKGGLIAAGAGALNVFAPVAGGFVLGSAAPMVGSIFYFASLVVFTILGGVLIAELIYILVLKAIQTALLVAQYMFAPVFLVFFATPDTEQIAAGYVKAFVETSLWTFVWVGLLKVMVIIIYSNFNPWGKILIAIGVLQMMIQVPGFLARAQISPMSDFVSAGLITGGLLKAFTGLSGVLSSGASSLITRAIEEKMVQGQFVGSNSVQHGLTGNVENPQLLNTLNKTSEDERTRWGGMGASAGGFGTGLGTPPDKLTGTPGASGLTPPTMKPATDQPPGIPGMPGTGTAEENKDGFTANLTQATALQMTPPPSKPQTPGPRPMSFAPPGGTAASSTTGNAAVSTGGKAAAFTGGEFKPNTEPYSWKTPAVENWDESNFSHVPMRKLTAQLTSMSGVGIRHNQAATSILGTAENGVSRVNLANGANEAEQTRALYTASFANTVAHDDPARDAARQAAFDNGAHQPKGFKQGLIANWLNANGHSWYMTPWAKENFNKGIFSAAVDGSAAYMSGGEGNAFTSYLNQRFGEWTPDRDAMAVHLITNPESAESPWNRNIGPATDALIHGGIPINMATRGAMQNMAIQGMHPSRRKQAVFAVLSYLNPIANERYGDEPLAVSQLGLGEMARALPADQVNTALAMFQVSGQADLNPTCGSYVAGLAADTGKDAGVAYSCLSTAAPYVAQQMGRVRAGTNLASIRTISDLDATIVPAVGETREQTMQMILETSCSALKTGEMHGIPMRTVMNPDVAPSIYEFMGSDIANINSPSAQRKLQIVSKNMSMVGTGNDTRTLNAILSVVENGGSLGAMTADHINVAAKLMDGGVSGSILPVATEVAVQGKYHASSSDSLPIKEIMDTAQHFATGQVTDYRSVPVVAALSRAGIQTISNQNIRIAAEAIADNGGQVNHDHVTAVLRVSQQLRNPNLAPGVVETFIRATGEQQGIPDAASMALPSLMTELEGRGTSIANIGSCIGSIQRSGGFSDFQMQDMATVNLVVERAGNSGPHGMQAINAVTRIIGAEQSAQNPRYIEVTEEFLSNNGRTKDLEVRSVSALADLDERRQVEQVRLSSMPANDPARALQQDRLDRFRLDNRTMQQVARDPNYQTGQGINDSIWSSLFV
ncbi:MAG: hypothetical protein K2W95_21640 [Candidatus Obscuribacterales bacterium]|nr:hypothetical protein [Candidatus Obscuribacterales bacterium]